MTTKDIFKLDNYNWNQSFYIILIFNLNLMNVLQAANLENLELFKTNFDALDCRGQEGFKKGYSVKNLDATGTKAQIYAPKSSACDHVGKYVTLNLSELEPMGLDL